MGFLDPGGGGGSEGWGVGPPPCQQDSQTYLAPAVPVQSKLKTVNLWQNLYPQFMIIFNVNSSLTP